MKLYIDESGQTGTDLYEADQPILTYAGIWLTPADSEFFATYLQTELSRQNRMAAEAKGASLVKNKRGSAFIANLFREMSGRSVPIAVCVAEKPFLAVICLIEDCSNSEFNPLFEVTWRDYARKIALGSAIIGELDASLLMSAWSARVQQRRELFLSTHDQILNLLLKSKKSVVTTAASNMRGTNLEAVFDSYTNVVYAQNVNAFGSFLICCEKVSKARGLADLEVIHDTQDKYQVELAEVFAVCQSVSHQDVYLHDKEAPLPITRLTRLLFQDSRNEVGIQLADILAAAARVVAREKWKLSPVERHTRCYLPELQDLCRRNHVAGGTVHVVGRQDWSFDLRKLLVG